MAYTINAYAMAQFTTAVITLAMVVLVWRKRHMRGGITLLLLFISIFIWSITAGFEAAAVSRTLKITWSKLSYFGAYLSPPFFLLFALFYTNRSFKVSPLKLVGLFIIPSVIISLAVTNEAHSLIWSGFRPGPAGTNSLIYEHGPLFWVGIIYIFTIVFLASLTMLLYSVKSQSLYKRQNRLIILASVFPITGTILYVSGLNPFPGMDIIPATFMFTGAALLVGISRQKLLDIIPISHEFLLDQFEDAVVVLDESMRIIDLNHAAEGLLIVERNEAIGRPGEETITLWTQLKTHFNPQVLKRIEITQNDPELKYLQTTLSPLRNMRGQFMGWTIVFTDITRRKTAELALHQVNTQLEKQLKEIQILQEKLQEQAIRDALTGAYNRGHLDAMLQRELARAKRKGYALSVLMIDIDHFKQINDSYGHNAGDLVIKSVAKMLMKDSRACDYVCRFGGDEFVVVMPEMGEEDAVSRAEKWRALLRSKRVIFRSNAIAPTISIGIAAFPRVDEGSSALVDAADRALYEAKEGGRDRVHVFST